MSHSSRRDFLLTAATVARGISAQPRAAQQLFHAGVCIGGRTAEAFLQSCQQASQAGFHYVESSGAGVRLADAYADRVSQLKEELQSCRLRLAGYAQYSEMSDPARRAELLELHLRIGRFARQAGAGYITQLWTPSAKPGIPPGELLKHLTPEDYRNFGRNASETGRRLREETGVHIGYHPEQEDVAAGLVDPVMESTDPRYFDFVPDVGHLTAGGLDPLEVYRKYRSRMIGTHFRDYDPDAEFERNGQPARGRFVPLGQGVVNLRGLVTYLKQTGFSGQVNAEGGRLDANRQYMDADLGLDLS